MPKNPQDAQAVLVGLGQLLILLEYNVLKQGADATFFKRDTAEIFLSFHLYPSLFLEPMYESMELGQR